MPLDGPAPTRNRIAIVWTKGSEHFRASLGGYFHGMVQKANVRELPHNRSGKRGYDDAQLIQVGAVLSQPGIDGNDPVDELGAGIEDQRHACATDGVGGLALAPLGRCELCL